MSSLATTAVKREVNASKLLLPMLCCAIYSCICSRPSAFTSRGARQAEGLEPPRVPKASNLCSNLCWPWTRFSQIFWLSLSRAGWTLAALRALDMWLNRILEETISFYAGKCTALLTYRQVEINQTRFMWYTNAHTPHSVHIPTLTSLTRVPSLSLNLWLSRFPLLVLTFCDSRTMMWKMFINNRKS